MDKFLSNMRAARSLLEKSDADTFISDSVFGYFVLKRSGLSETEKKHILGLAGRTYRYYKIEPHLRDLYPNGSFEKGHHSQGPPQRRRWGFFGESMEAIDEDAQLCQSASSAPTELRVA